MVTATMMQYACLVLSNGCTDPKELAGIDPGPTHLGLTTGSPGLCARVKSPVSQGRISFVTADEAADTTRPVIPSVVQWPSVPLTVVSALDPNFTYYRDVVGLAFADTASGTTVNAFLQFFGATVIGAAVGTETLPSPTYYLRVPDPGASWAAVDSLRLMMASRPGVVAVGAITFGAVLRLRAP